MAALSKSIADPHPHFATFSLGARRAAVSLIVRDLCSLATPEISPLMIISNVRIVKSALVVRLLSVLRRSRQRSSEGTYMPEHLFLESEIEVHLPALG
jgi:hypothetical protein